MIAVHLCRIESCDVGRLREWQLGDGEKVGCVGCVVAELPVAPTWLFRSAEVLKVALHRVTGMAVTGDITTGI
jgi:hypothetical protein